MISINSIFFDIGNIFFYDYPVKSFFFNAVFEEAKQSKHHFLIEAFFSVKRDMDIDTDSWIYSVMQELFGDRWETVNTKCWSKVLGNWQKLMIPIKDNIEVFNILKNRHHIYFAANQPSRIRKTLSDYNLDDRVKGIYLDQEIGISKPNPGFFERIIIENGLTENTILMVGDRIDNDIRPAKALGLKTCLIKTAIPSYHFDLLSDEWHIAFQNFMAEITTKDTEKSDFIGKDLSILRKIL